MLNHRFFVVLGLIALLNNISPTPVSAQEKASTAAPAWASKCESISRKEALNCNVEQRVILQQTGQQVARMVIQVTAAEVRKPALLIHVPLGLSIRAGLTMTIDEAEPIKFDIQTCDASGCYAGIRLKTSFWPVSKRENP